MAEYDPKNPPQLPVPEPLGLGRRIAFGLGQGLMGQNPVPALQEMESQRVKTIAANQDIARQAKEDAFQQEERARIEQERKLAKEDADPTSARSQQAREAWAKSAAPIAQALKINPTVVDQYASGRSRKQLLSESPSEQLLEIAKINAMHEKRKAQEDREGSSDYQDARKKVTDMAIAAVAGGRGTTQTVGRAVRRVQDANNMLQLLDKAAEMKDIKPDSPLAKELAVGIAGLLGGGNAPAESTIKGLMPKTLQGSIADMRQYITGNPQVFLTPGRIAQMRHTLERERDYWTKEKNRFGGVYREAARPFFSKYKDLEDTFDAVIAQSGDDTSLAAPQLAPRDQEALDWANANSNDPRAGAIKARLGAK